MEKQKETKKKKTKSCDFNCLSGGKRCNKSPCEENKNRFGKHERIIEYFIEQKLYSDAYFYFVDLLHLFNINCDYSKLETLRAENPNTEIETKNLPLGCRVFKISDDLKRHKETIDRYSKLIVKKGKSSLSDEGLEIYKDAKHEFINLINGNLKILAHLVMKTNHDRYEREIYHKKALEYLEKSIEASKKYGIHVNPPNMIEQGFSAAIGEAGFNDNLSKKDLTRQDNELRLKEAKKTAFIEQMRKELLENGKLTEETKDKLKEYGVI